MEFYANYIERLEYDTLNLTCKIDFISGKNIMFNVKHLNEIIFFEAILYDFEHYRKYKQKLLNAKIDNLPIEPDDYEYTKFIF